MSPSGWTVSAPLGVGLAVALMIAGAGAANCYLGAGSTGDRSSGPYCCASNEAVATAAARPVTAQASSGTGTVTPLSDSLEIQRDMARSSWLAAIAALASLLVTAVGIYFVREMLAANRSAVDAARKATLTAREVGEAQVRAYLSVSHAELTLSYPHPSVSVTLANSGGSPAIDVNVRVDLELAFDRVPQITLDLDTAGFLAGSIGAGHELRREALVRVVDLEPLRKRIKSATAHFRVRVTAQYMDVFGAERQDRFEFMASVRKSSRGEVVAMEPLPARREAGDPTA